MLGKMDSNDPSRETYETFQKVENASETSSNR